MIPQIYLDLDDVLNTASPALLRQLGADIGPSDYAAYRETCGGDGMKYDIVAHANAALPGRDFNYATFWTLFNADVWATLPVSAECNWLIELSASLVGKENVRVLTAPVVGPGADENVVGKLWWAHYCLPSWLKMGIEQVKGRLGSPGRLLIDDAKHNVDLWEAHGGSALLWARPWNDAKAMTREEVTSYLESWVEHADTECSER